MLTNERVRFIGFGNSSLDIEIFAYVLTTDHAEFLEIQESILVKIKEIIEVSDSESLKESNKSMEEPMSI